MARILIGNIKGPQGEQGPQGIQGPVGPQGPKGDTGPMPTLINNGTTTQAGVGALDAAYGKTLTDKDTDLQNQLNTLNGKTEEIETELSGITTFQDFSQSGVVINSNGVKEVQINIAKEGYSPIAAEAITIGSGNAIDKYFINSSNMLMVLVRNMESSQHTNDMSFRVRYIKNFAGGS